MCDTHGCRRQQDVTKDQWNRMIRYRKTGVDNKILGRYPLFFRPSFLSLLLFYLVFPSFCLGLYFFFISLFLISFFLLFLFFSRRTAVSYAIVTATTSDHGHARTSSTSGIECHWYLHFPISWRYLIGKSAERTRFSPGWANSVKLFFFLLGFN